VNKQEQKRKAQKIKKELRKLGIKLNMKVSQEVGSDTIAIFMSNGKWHEVEDGYIIVLDEVGDIERLTHDEYTTILDVPTEEHIANYLKGVK